MQYYRTNIPFELESGASLPALTIGYTTYGTRKPDDSNVVWICHALTANAEVNDWWKGVVGDKGVFNPKEHFIICANILGSTYGTTGPLSINPQTGKPYYHTFPVFTVRDMVRAHKLLRDRLHIRHIQTLVGGSLGGQQALEWAIDEPEFFQNLVLLATNAKSSPWGIAFRESQRLAIETDITWLENREDAGAEGLKVARSIALLSYRNYDSYALSQSETNKEKTDDFRASAYQRYQGVKLATRFNAYSYYLLTKAMDAHNIGRNRGDIELILKKIQARTLVIGITSDLLFPMSEQQFIARHIPHAEFAEIESLYGHDGFLVEVEQLNTVIGNYLVRSNKYKRATYDNN